MTQREGQQSEQEQQQSSEQEQNQKLERRNVAALPDSPFATMRRMMESLFGGGDFELERRVWTPRIDVFERGNELVVRADLPGLSEEEVSITLDNDVLAISGERDYEQRDRGLYERARGTFYRAIKLPRGVSADQIRASFTNGVLEVAIPIPEEKQARQIPIQGQETQTKH